MGTSGNISGLINSSELAGDRSSNNHLIKRITSGRKQLNAVSQSQDQKAGRKSGTRGSTRN